MYVTVQAVEHTNGLLVSTYATLSEVVVRYKTHSTVCLPQAPIHTTLQLSPRLGIRPGLRCHASASWPFPVPPPSPSADLPMFAKGHITCRIMYMYLYTCTCTCIHVHTMCTTVYVILFTKRDIIRLPQCPVA